MDNFESIYDKMYKNNKMLNKLIQLKQNGSEKLNFSLLLTICFSSFVNFFFYAHNLTLVTFVFVYLRTL